MATPECMSSDEAHNPVGPAKATFIGTFLENGDSVRVCDECMPNFCAAVFERMTGVDMTPALYLRSVEGQANPDGPVGHPEEVAAPVEPYSPPKSDVDPTDVGPDRTAEQQAANDAADQAIGGPASADTDQEAETVPTGASETADSDVIAPATASSTDASSEAAPPPETAAASNGRAG